MTGATANKAPERRPGAGSIRFASVDVAQLVTRWALVGVLGLLVLGFSLLEPAVFPTGRNFSDILTAQPVAIFVALAAMIALVTGEFDLSIGANLALAQYAVIALSSNQGLSWQLAIVATLLGGLVIGLVNGVLVVHVGLNSFISTIGVSTVLSGLLQWYSDGGAPIFGGAADGFVQLGQDKLFGIALPVYYALVVAAALWALVEYTVLGRDMRATGANRDAAFLSGIATARARMIAFALAGVLAALGGVVLSAQIGAAQSDVGAQYLLPAFAAVFLGATAVRPGYFNVWGTVIAIFVVAVGITGLQLEGVASWVTPVFNGVVLLVALTVANAAGRRRTRRTAIIQPAAPEERSSPGEAAT